LELEEVISRLHDASASLCTEHFAGGLSDLHVARTRTRFLALGLVHAPDGNDVPQEYPVLPAKPNAPAPGASATTLELYREHVKIFFAVRQGITALRLKLLGAVGDVIRDELRALPGGLAAQDLPAILQYLDTHYGAPSEDDLNTLTATLRGKFASVATFRSDAPKMAITFQKLERFGHTVSPLDQMNYLQSAVDLLPPIVEALKDYKKTSPVHNNRSFDGMVAYVKTHVSLTTAGSVGYAGAAVAEPLSVASIVDALLPRLVEHFAGAGMSAVGRSDTGGRGGGRGGRGTPGRGTAGRGVAGRGGAGHGSSTDPLTAKKYCFHHGYGHSGSKCRVMAVDTSYTDAMKAATAPCTLDGYEGHP
jgi:hypothetical protein